MIIFIYFPYNIIATFDKCGSLSSAMNGNVQETARLSGRNLYAHLRLAYDASVVHQLIHVQLRSSEKHPPSPRVLRTGADPL